VTGHVRLSTTGAFLGARAMLRAVNGRELDDTPAERDEVEVLAAMLDRAKAAGLSQLVIELGDEEARADLAHADRSIIATVRA
jgi:hypothetical protein